MLRALSVKDFALMDELHLEFKEGFTVLTGETGAGKSILIDAISYVMGNKFNREFIRTGKDKTRVEATVDCPKKLESVLMQADIKPRAGKITLARENTLSGRSFAWINDKPVLVTYIKDLAKDLLDIHGQHHNQNLLDPDQHLGYLDAFGQIQTTRAFQDYGHSYGQLKELEGRLNKLTRNNERDAMMDFISFQVEEIKKAGLSVEEERQLLEKEALLSHAQKIGEALLSVKAALAEEGLDAIQKASRNLEAIKEVFPRVADLPQIMADAYYNLVEVRRDAEDLTEEIYFNQAELDDINSRLFQYETMHKKYGETTEEVLEKLSTLEEDLFELSHAETRIKELKAEIAEKKAELLDLGEVLSRQRQGAAKDLADKLNSELKQVGLGKADFMPLVTKDNQIRENGLDEVHFLISTNTGEPRKPLEKIVSGGELSRIMLAMKSTFIHRDHTPTVIFDEIDTGISGRIAQAVGEKMVKIAEEAQVLCVTHLPQIAAWSHHHAVAKKMERGGRTRSLVEYVSQAEKAEEIAKMMAGDVLTESALANAKELMDQARA